MAANTESCVAKRRTAKKDIGNTRTYQYLYGRIEPRLKDADVCLACIPGVISLVKYPSFFYHALWHWNQIVYLCQIVGVLLNWDILKRSWLDELHSVPQHISTKKPRTARFTWVASVTELDNAS